MQVTTKGPNCSTQLILFTLHPYPNKFVSLTLLSWDPYNPTVVIDDFPWIWVHYLRLVIHTLCDCYHVRSTRSAVRNWQEQAVECGSQPAEILGQSMNDRDPTNKKDAVFQKLWLGILWCSASKTLDLATLWCASMDTSTNEGTTKSTGFPTKNHRFFRWFFAGCPCSIVCKDQPPQELSDCKIILVAALDPLKV